jgi:hypothetical protein
VKTEQSLYPQQQKLQWTAAAAMTNPSSYDVELQIKKQQRLGKIQLLYHTARCSNTEFKEKSQETCCQYLTFLSIN